MTKLTFLLILFLSVFLPLSAQISPENISDRMQEIDEYILSEEYNEALAICLELLNAGTDNPNLDFKTGFCYLNTIDEKDKALPLLKKASFHISKDYNAENLMEERAPLETLLYLGDAYRTINNFEEAIRNYKKYAQEATSINAEAQAISQKE